MNPHKLIMYLAGVGIVYCLVMAVVSKAQSNFRTDDIKTYECKMEQYAEVNYATNMCMMENGYIHERCFYIVVTHLCEKRTVN